MDRKILIISGAIILLLVAVILSKFLSDQKEAPPEIDPKEYIIYTETAFVEYRDVSPVIREGGKLGSNNYVDVTSEVQGEILKGNVNLKRGQSFKKGELLVNIFDKETRYNLKASKSRFINSVANSLPDLKIDFFESYDKWLNFFNSINIDDELPELPEISSSKEKIFLAGRNILNDYYNIKSAEVRLNKYSIYAPFNGTFSDVMLEVGSIANPGSRIARIIRTDKLELEIPIKVEDINRIKVGDKVEMTTDITTSIIEGVIVRIADYVASQTQSVSVFINISCNNSVRLYEGLYLTASFNAEVLENVMEIPRNAVFNTDMVYIVKKGKLVKEQINIHKINEKTLIFSGLEPGTELVIEPLVNAHEGTVVEKI